MFPATDSRWVHDDVAATRCQPRPHGGRQALRRSAADKRNEGLMHYRHRQATLLRQRHGLRGATPPRLGPKHEFDAIEAGHLGQGQDAGQRQMVERPGRQTDHVLEHPCVSVRSPWYRPYAAMVCSTTAGTW